MSSNRVDLTEVLESAIQGFLDDVRVGLPGEIRSYDADSRRATVQLMVPDGWIDKDTGERRTTEHRPLVDVPVKQIGSGSIRVKIPIKPGDPCWVMFASSCIVAWKATGRLLDPKDDRRHHESDAYAMPIPRVVGDVEDDAMIEFTDDGKIHAGGSKALVTQEQFMNHTHATAGTGTPSPPIALAPSPALTGTDVLKGG